jgi:hypothetical protein
LGIAFINRAVMLKRRDGLNVLLRLRRRVISTDELMTRVWRNLSPYFVGCEKITRARNR